LVQFRPVKSRVPSLIVLAHRLLAALPAECDLSPDKPNKQKRLIGFGDEAQVILKVWPRPVRERFRKEIAQQRAAATQRQIVPAMWRRWLVHDKRTAIGSIYAKRPFQKFLSYL
jgi:hypothetical protein